MIVLEDGLTETERILRVTHIPRDAPGRTTERGQIRLESEA